MIKQQLITGLRQLNIILPDATQEKLFSYLELLNKWNKAFNLTAIRDPQQMVDKHLLDSLAVCPYLEGEWVLDVGSGAGLPGIPLALVFPTKSFVLLDSNGKKTRFLTQAAHELALNNVTVVQSRVENYQHKPLFDVIISRAFAEIPLMIEQTKHLCDQKGQFIAMKGQYPLTELDHLPKKIEVTDIHAFTLPNEPAQRHIVIMKCKL